MNMFRICSNTSLVTLAMLGSTQAQAQTEDSAAGEIIVTATRRAESAQKVPISMTVLDPRALSRVESGAELAQMVPNVQIEQTAGLAFTRVGIRGIAQSDFNANATTSNMMYLDDVPLNAPIAQGVAIWDMDRIEVLRGPQGTLFGRNATGGAIRYISKMPGDEFGGNAEVTLGRFNHQEVRAALGGPVTDTVGLRLSFIGSKTDGDTFNVYRNERDGKRHFYGVRGVLVFKPTDTVTAVLRAQYFKGGTDPIMVKSTRGLATQDGFLPASDLAALQASYGYQNLAYSSNYNLSENGMLGREEIKHLPISLNIDVDLGGATLTSNTGYLRVNQFFRVDDDASPAPILDEYDKHRDVQWTQELRLTSNGDGPFKWIAGAFYMHEKVDTTLAFDASAWLTNTLFPDAETALYTRGSHQKTESYAGFVNTTYQLTDKLLLTGGLRYTHESKDITYDFRSRWEFSTSGPGTSQQTIDFIKAVDSGNLGNLLQAANPSFTGGTSWNNLSWKIALDYQLASRTLLYGLISRGFKGGSFQPNANLRSQVLNADGSLISVKPETITDFEVGAKADLVPGALRVNASAYYYDYKNYQTNQFIAAIAGQQLSSLPKARVMGAELEVRAEPIQGLIFDLGFGYTDSKIVRALDPTLEGNKLPLAEDFNANGSVRYVVETGFGTITPEITAKYRGKYYTNKENDVQLGDYVILNAQIQFESESKRLYGSLWTKNFTNQRRVVAVDDSFEFFGSNLSYVTPRATYGITVGSRF